MSSSETIIWNWSSSVTLIQIGELFKKLCPLTIQSKELRGPVLSVPYVIEVPNDDPRSRIISKY